jgi:hypothetical protein
MLTFEEVKEKYGNKRFRLGTFRLSEPVSAMFHSSPRYKERLIVETGMNYKDIPQYPHGMYPFKLYNLDKIRSIRLKTDLTDTVIYTREEQC